MAATRFNRAQKNQKPGVQAITPRRMDFEFPDVPRYWANNDPVVTHLFNAFSTIFPEGEKFFVDAVRAHRHLVTDPARRKEISGFIGQEAMHSKEHDAFNRMLSSHGYQRLVERCEAQVREGLAEARIDLTPRRQLAITAALEHITAVMAHHLLSDRDIAESLHPAVRNLWLWHAIEETEHKAVAFDLYQELPPSYSERVSVFLKVTLGLSFTITFYTLSFLRADGLASKPKVLARGAWRLFGRKGLLSRMLPDYLTYLKPGFHPWDQDNRELLAQWQHVLETRQPEVQADAA